MVQINKVIVAGGGSAGWLAALFYKKIYPAVDIVVIEDPNSLPIIAGESCTIPFVELLEYLEIDFFDWIKATDALPKLGGLFCGWEKNNSKFIQPLFSRYLNRWLYENPEFGDRKDFLKSIVSLGVPFSSLVPSSKLIQDKKSPWTNSSDMILKPMYHFDSRKNAEYLKKLGLKRNVKLIESKIISYETNELGIEKLILENKEIQADLYIDCTGFQQLLLKKALDSKLVDYSQYISNSSVIAWWDDSQKLPYTEMHAMEYGWRFNVSLRSRSGNGYIYDSSKISKEDALKEISTTVGKEIKPIAAMTWKPELSIDPWKQNVLALGLSTGFLEPLGSPGHTLIALQLKLFDTICNGFLDLSIANKYNAIYKTYIDDTLDFICMHYLGSKKHNNFWKDKKDQKNIPASLIEKISEIQIGIFDDSKYPVYSIENYLTVMQALNLIDSKLISKFVNNRDTNLQSKCEIEYKKLQDEINLVTNDCISIDEWIKNYG